MFGCTLLAVWYIQMSFYKLMLCLPHDLHTTIYFISATKLEIDMSFQEKKKQALMYFCASLFWGNPRILVRENGAPWNKGTSLQTGEKKQPSSVEREI